MTAIEFLGDRRMMTARERSTEPVRATAAGTANAPSDREIAVTSTPTDESVPARFSPDPLGGTDRYRLVTPYAPHLW